MRKNARAQRLRLAERMGTAAGVGRHAALVERQQPAPGIARHDTGWQGRLAAKLPGNGHDRPCDATCENATQARDVCRRNWARATPKGQNDGLGHDTLRCFAECENANVTVYILDMPYKTFRARDPSNEWGVRLVWSEDGWSLLTHVRAYGGEAYTDLLESGTRPCAREPTGQMRAHPCLRLRALERATLAYRRGRLTCQAVDLPANPEGGCERTPEEEEQWRRFRDEPVRVMRGGVSGK